MTEDFGESLPFFIAILKLKVVKYESFVKEIYAFYKKKEPF
ncbi:hypothetical protein FH5_00695 [Priestia endophytica]|nr:hypothetical protein FH5_00695 [Priestia endophytica]